MPTVLTNITIITGVAAGLAAVLFTGGRYFQKAVCEIVDHHEREEWKKEVLKGWRR